VLDDAVLDAAPRLKWSGQLDCSRTGAECALRRKLPVSLGKFCWSPAVSEMALTLTLGLLRRTSDYHAAMRAGTETWVGDFPASIDLRERELTRRPVGIIGFGRIGRRYRELLAPFDCPVRVYDPYLPAEAAAATGVQAVDLSTLLAESDVVVVCAANNRGSTKLIGAPEFARLRQDAVFINVARSALVDYDALCARLAHGDVTAALDVFDQEPLPVDSPLRKQPNLYLTPHRAGGLMASVERGLGQLVGDYARVLDGQAPQFPLLPQMLPGLDG
jgi:phosphoglycerate dehydrogenase-like enzyme